VALTNKQTNRFGLQPYHCVCGASVDTRGSNALSCKRNPGSSQRHHLVNDLIWHALSKTGLPFIKEPCDNLRSDNKRSDSLTLIPWRDGHCSTWDVTVTDTVALSYLSMSSACAASAAEAATKRKEDKYTEISCNYLFFSIAIAFHQSLMPMRDYFHLPTSFCCDSTV